MRCLFEPDLPRVIAAAGSHGWTAPLHSTDAVAVRLEAPCGSPAAYLWLHWSLIEADTLHCHLVASPRFRGRVDYHGAARTIPALASLMGASRIVVSWPRRREALIWFRFIHRYLPAAVIDGCRVVLNL